MTRTWIALLGGGLGLLMVAGLCSRTPPLTVEVVEARAGALRVLVSTNGVIEPVDDTEVRARLDGRIVAMPDPGKFVDAGEEIARIDGGPVAVELARARSDLLAAEESLRVAGHALAVARDRLAIDKKLFGQQALSRERYAESQAAHRDADAHARALEHEVPLRTTALELRVAELESQRESAIIRASFAGTVYRTDVEEGAMVRVGDPLLRIADLERLRVRANIDQVDLGRVRVGQTVVVAANAFPDDAWLGKVTEVVPHVVERDNRLIAEGLAELTPPTNGLVPGMSVDVDIVVAETEEALQVPSGAVHTRDGESIVYRIERGRVRATPVTVGLASVADTEVTAGLEVGDVVVVGTARGLVDGMRVHTRVEGS